MKSPFATEFALLLSTFPQYKLEEIYTMPYIAFTQLVNLAVKAQALRVLEMAKAIGLAFGSEEVKDWVEAVLKDLKVREKKKTGLEVLKTMKMQYGFIQDLQQLKNQIKIKK